MQQWSWRRGKWKGVFAHAWYDGAGGQGMYLSGQGFPGDGTVTRFSGAGWYVRLQAQRAMGERWNAWMSWQYARSHAPVESLDQWREPEPPTARSTVQLQVQYSWGKGD